MDTTPSNPQTIDEYIAAFPPAVQTILGQIRETVRRVAPGATERISYRIPTFTLKGHVIHFAAFSNHVGIYPGSEAVEVFREELVGYESSKGTIRFPLDRPIPYELIARIAAYRVEANAHNAMAKKKK